MTEPDILDLAIHALKELQRVSWQKLADPLLTTFERRELRNHLKQSDGELRHYLELMSERVRFRTPVVEDVGDSLAKLNFRILPRSGASAGSMSPG